MNATKLNANHILTTDATPAPNAAPDVVMSDAYSSSVDMGPEAALQGLMGALRARHDPPPGQRAVTTNGWHAVDELELHRLHAGNASRRACCALG